MSLEQEILDAIRAAQSRPRPLLDAATGRKWQVRLQMALSAPVQDKTSYFSENAYLLQAALPHNPESYWVYYLRVWISAIGPYATHAFVRESKQARWGGACQLNRSGFEPDHRQVRDELRKWYAEQGLIELDDRTRAIPVSLPGGGETHVHRCLFGSWLVRKESG